ncbi:MAG: hypothetical protein Q4E62_09440 [Sutterellaceae bacterium]|nr:hypothetical protein [Sutterellaceae bacterium]
MLKKITVAALFAMATAVYAAPNIQAPPEVTPVPSAVAPKAPAPAAQDVPRTRQGDTTTYNASRLEPTAEDMQRARENQRRKEAAGAPKPYVSDYGTVIEEKHDQNNRLTEIRVTPGTTEIPYTMKNRSDRPIDNRPGADPRSTLDTPKFIQFGW